MLVLVRGCLGQVSIYTLDHLDSICPVAHLFIRAFKPVENLCTAAHPVFVKSPKSAENLLCVVSILS